MMSEAPAQSAEDGASKPIPGRGMMGGGVLQGCLAHFTAIEGVFVNIPLLHFTITLNL